jgi:hypothetical protein
MATESSGGLRDLERADRRVSIDESTKEPKNCSTLRLGKLEQRLVWPGLRSALAERRPPSSDGDEADRRKPKRSLGSTICDRVRQGNNDQFILLIQWRICRTRLLLQVHRPTSLPYSS